MKYFNEYSSNTIAGSSNQHFFTMENGEVRTSRAFYKIAVGGKFRYSLLFSNIIDSTFADGSVSHKNLICEEYKILGARVGKCASIEAERMTAKEEELNLRSITFGGRLFKDVAAGEFFTSDPIELEFECGEYLCLEMTFSGEMIPYHEESLLPIFKKCGGEWIYDKKMPLPSMLGCDREISARIGFLGDSITQGIGTPINSYAHWNARVSERLGRSYAYWNLGIGYARADDAASDGVWLYKAKQNDLLVVCFGVNDILQGFSALQIENNLRKIVDKLSEKGVKVVFQTIPPFDYEGEKIKVWEEVNRYIKEELSTRVLAVFDAANYLKFSLEEPHRAKFGGHPNEEGCAVWAAELYPVLKEVLK